jgi:hypothetical protein
MLCEVSEAHGRRADSFWGQIVGGPGNIIPATRVTISVVTRIGIELVPQVNGRIMGVSCYLDSGLDPPFECMIVDRAAVHYPRVYHYKWGVPTTGTAWRNTWIRPALRVTSGTTYDIWVMMTQFYWRTVNLMSGGPLTRFSLKCNGSMQATGTLPPSAPTLNANGNGVDVLFMPD